MEKIINENLNYDGQDYPIKLEPAQEEGNYILSVYYEDVDEWEELAEVYQVTVNGKKCWTFNRIFISLFNLQDWYDKTYDSVQDIIRGYFQFMNKNY